MNCANSVNFLTYCSCKDKLSFSSSDIFECLLLHHYPIHIPIQIQTKIKIILTMNGIIRVFFHSVDSRLVLGLVVGSIVDILDADVGLDVGGNVLNVGVDVGVNVG
eukprot:480265_1